MMNKIKIAITELENTDKNREILIEFIAQYKGKKSEKEKLLGLKAKTLDNIIIKKKINNIKLAKIAKKLAEYVQNT